MLRLKKYCLHEPKKYIVLITSISVAAIGTYLLASSHATPIYPYASVEAESGTLTSPVITVYDATASGGEAIEFGSQSGSSTSDTVSVYNSSQLTAALAAATPGQTIELANGTYDGNFATTVSGTATSPITLTGSRKAELVGSSISGNYVLHLDGADYWHIEGIALTGAQKGIVLDKSNHDTINGVEVYGVGDEGIHLRETSTHNIVENSYVHNTGLYKAIYGEGIYVGSAVSNWPLYGNTLDQYRNDVDASDDNSVIGNTVSNTGAEDIDTKEGTMDNTISGNFLSNPGQGTAGLDVKGNNYTVSSNTFSGATTDNGAIEVWELVTGYGQDNSFTNNKIGVTGSALGIYVGKGARGNSISCSNTITQPSAGLSNQACIP